MRIESTNASYITGPAGVRYPGELLGHTPGARALLVQTGHSGRQWSPMAFCCAIGNHAKKRASHRKTYVPNPGLGENERGAEEEAEAENLGNNNNLGRVEYAPSPPDADADAEEEANYGVGFGSGRTGVETSNTVISASTASSSRVPFDPFTLLAAETRRQIREAISRYPDEPFDVRGALLPGFVGDEAWRATASRADFVLERRPGAAGDALTCTDPATGEECAPWVRAVLLTPPSDHWFGRLMRRLLLSQPYPILAEDLEAHGHTRRLQYVAPHARAGSCAPGPFAPRTDAPSLASPARASCFGP